MSNINTDAVKQEEERKRDHFESFEPGILQAAREIQKVVGKGWFTPRELHVKSKRVPNGKEYGAPHIAWLADYGFIEQTTQNKEAVYKISLDPERRKYIIRNKQTTYLRQVTDWNFVLRAIDIFQFKKISEAGVVTEEQLRWFDEILEPGDEGCICSHCEGAIEKDSPVVKIGHDVDVKELRYHLSCFKFITDKKNGGGSAAVPSDQRIETTSEVTMIPGKDFTYRCIKDFHAAGAEDVNMPLIKEGYDGVYDEKTGNFHFGICYYSEDEMNGTVPVDESLTPDQKTRELERIASVASHFERVTLNQQ